MKPNPQTEQILAEQIAAQIRAGAPRPLNPQALLREHMSAFSPFLGLNEVPLRQHLALAQRVFAALVADGIVRPASPRPDVTQEREALRERAAAMPDSPHPQRDSNAIPFDDASGEQVR